MITQLKIENFKSHKNTDLQLRNLILLTGVNGCGKTSIIQSLLLMRQSFLKGRLAEGLDLNKPLCSVGIAHDALYRLAKNGILSFEFKDESSNIYQLKFNAEHNLNDSFIIKHNYSPNIVPEELIKLSLFNNDFQYISASRWGGRSAFPKETYAAETQKQISLDDGQGELVAQFLYKYGGDVVPNYTDEVLVSKLHLLDQVIYWEQKVSPRVTIRVESGNDNNSYTINYGFEGDENNKPLENLKAQNIGYGISYTLPVIVALLSAKPGALIILENPEAHLHPAGQAELAKLMTRVAENGIQVIVETHSDHIINGVLVACNQFEKKMRGINKDKVCIYYMNSKDEQHATKVQEVKVQEKGVDYQPEGFFDQAEKDMYKLFNE
ncbi:AAA family ATPase [Macellibacteroides fermentans]|uniref:Putative ATPase n=1 Tax=Macellibacteroides fermentans TaxID=879969 RepID=A0A8E2D508_9PORP|nr:DUF3696 domain-containing protein [Macellibacteroides fermentans]NYI50662.1 putative ATPase [Macellibacteroides fermentans]